MSGEDKDLPGIPQSVPQELRGALERMREAVQRLMGTRGSPGRAALRWDDFADEKLADVARKRLLLNDVIQEAVEGAGSGTGGYTPDLTAPPTPTGLSATAGLSHVMVEWDAPVYSAGHGHKQTLVYATKQPEADPSLHTFADAVLVATAPLVQTVIAIPSDLSIKWRIWVAWESVDGVVSSPAGGTNGQVATTGKVGNADLGPLIVEAANLAAGAVTSAKFAASIEPVTLYTTESLPTVKSTNAIYYGGKIYRWDSTAYVASVPAADISGTVTDAQIAGLAASKVTGTLTDAQIAAIAAAKITGQITGTQITNGAVTTAKLAAGAVTANEIAANTITGNEIAANAITAGKIAAGSVTTAKLAAGAVTATEIAAGAVTAGKVAANAITATELAAGAVTAGKVAAGAISAFEIAAGAITATKLAANAIAVGSAAIENGAITNAMLGNAIIDDAKVANMSVAKLTSGSLSVGANAQSSNYVGGSLGWIIRGDGYAEFSNVVIRGATYTGTIYANGGTIGGATIGATYIQSTNWVNLTTGWQLKNDGSGQIGGISILSDRIQSGNYSLNETGFTFRADGTGQVGGIKLTGSTVESGNFSAGTSGFQLKKDGAAEFQNVKARGDIEATSIKADAANIVKTIHIADNAVTIPVASSWDGEVTSASTSSPVTLATTPSADFEGQKVIVTAAVTGYLNGYDGGATSFNAVIRVYRDGVTQVGYRLGRSSYGSVAQLICYLQIIDSPPAGNHYYTVTYLTSGVNYSFATSASILALGTKK